MIVTGAIFLGGLVVLLLSARWFTRAAENLGEWLRFPPFVTGIFIIGIGTSLPELVAGVTAAAHGNSEIVAGNVIGANISNLLLLLGAAMLLTGRDIVLGQRYLMIDLHYLLGSAVLITVFMIDGVMHWHEGLIGAAVFACYSTFLIRTGSRETEAQADGTRRAAPWVAMAIVVGSGLGIFWGAQWTIAAVADIAAHAGVSPAIIALTLLALGTTLPEMAVNYFALRQGKAEMAVGNILGSCIFNSLMIPACAGAFGPLDVPPQILAFPLPFLPVATALFYLLALDKKISLWEGLLFLAIYFVFILKSTGLG